MSGHNVLHELELANSNNLVTYTATPSATLTAAQVRVGAIVGTHASVAIAFTLPVAGAVVKGVSLKVCCGGAAAVTVVVTAGYGGVGAGGDTITLAQGEFVTVFCDGTNWYAGTLTTEAIG